MSESQESEKIGAFWKQKSKKGMEYLSGEVNGGRVTDLEGLKSAISELECIKSAGDSLTGFVPTKMDLVDLANTLAEDLISCNFHFRFCVGTSDLNWRDHVSYRLGRILHYLPELEPKITAKLRRGYEENDAAEPKEIERMKAEAQRHSEAEENMSSQ